MSSCFFKRNLSESESNSATGVRTHLVRGCSQALGPLRYGEFP